MTWSRGYALEQEKKALRLLLDYRDGTRSLDWCEESGSGFPNGVWSRFLEKGLVTGNVVGGGKWRLTVNGWIEACRLLRDEIDLDKRFGVLNKHLKDRSDRKELYTTVTVQAIVANTGLSECWVRDAICGQMAERIYGRHGAKIDSMSGYVDIPSCIGNELTTTAGEAGKHVSVW
jgi:hypothetical protein